MSIAPGRREEKRREGRRPTGDPSPTMADSLSLLRFGCFSNINNNNINTVVVVVVIIIIIIISNPQKCDSSSFPQNIRQIRGRREVDEGKGGGVRMRAGAGGSFKIALFADLHFGENAWTDWGPQQDVNSIKVMSSVLHRETPDFVVYLGDVITANNIAIANASKYWEQAISPTRERGIPWSSVFGNHDDAAFVWPIQWFSPPGIPQLHCPGEQEYCTFRGTQRIELLKKEIALNPLSYSINGPKELWPSISNYILYVSSSHDALSPVVFMYFLDSGGGSYPEVISSAQADWFKLKSEEINPDESVPELIFWHIPSKAYQRVAPRFGIHKPCVGSINRERVAAQEAELGIMDILVNRSSVKAIFVGHNHGLDWCCPYKKLWLCFARHTGYGGYGNWARGARILEITEQPFSIKSWIRMEDGAVTSEVLLST